MIIQKVINNNVVSTFDMNNHEVILMGKGIGFRKKAGDAAFFRNPMPLIKLTGPVKILF